VRGFHISRRKPLLKGKLFKYPRTTAGNEEKLTPLEEKRPDALEMAKEAHEARKEKAVTKVMLILGK
jgi:hypothetical protein